MKKLKAVAVACGAITAVCVGAPAFADEAPADAAPVEAADTAADGQDAPDSEDVYTDEEMEQARKQSEAEFVLIRQVLAMPTTTVEQLRERDAKLESLPPRLRETARTMLKTREDAARQQRQEQQESYHALDTGGAYGKLDGWIKDRDARMREAIVGLSDSQTLGLNPFRPGR